MAHKVQTVTPMGGHTAQGKPDRCESGIQSRGTYACPLCQARIEAGDFCRKDGGFRDPFVMGERYEVTDTIGKGGMGFVFGGHHRILGKPVAIKVFDDASADPEQAQRFLREARLASQLRHENIVGVLDFGSDAERSLRYIVMDRLRGESLAEVIERGPMAAARLVPILLQLARALAHAHEQAIVHRDVTPRNIVLEHSSGRNDLVRLCDFGISRQVGGDDRVTRTGEFLGTPAYMAPAQIRGDDLQGPEVDIYALGCVAYEALTGVLPHSASTPVAVIAARLAGPPVAPRTLSDGVPIALDSLVMACLASNPDERPSATALQQALSNLVLPNEADNTPVDLLGQSVGSYTITQLVGAGGVGMVYRGEHPSIGTKVAVKVLRPELASVPDVVERFVREARTANELRSPYLPRYYDFGALPDGRAYAVMEFLEGESLADLLSRGRLPVARAKRLLLQVLEALEVTHAAGVVHRDIKPDNIFVTRDEDGTESIRVLDFGIASAPLGDKRKLTLTNTFVGTPVYCAPEQILGREATPQADLYALGITAFEMLTGAEPSIGIELEDLFTAKLEGVELIASAHAPDVPPEADRTILRATERAPTKRFSTAGDMARSVEGWPEVSDEAVPLPVRSKPLAWVVGSLVFCALLPFAWMGDGARPNKAATDKTAEVPHAALPFGEQTPEHPENAEPPLGETGRPLNHGATNTEVSIQPSPSRPPSTSRNRSPAPRTRRSAGTSVQTRPSEMEPVRPTAIAHPLSPTMRPVIADPFE